MVARPLESMWVSDGGTFAEDERVESREKKGNATAQQHDGIQFFHFVFDVLSAWSA